LIEIGRFDRRAITSKSKASAGRPQAKLVLDPRDVDTAGGEQHVQVIDEIGGLLDEPLVALLERGDRELDCFFPHFPRTGSNAFIE
jgi:hypothetical protein